MQMYVNVFRKDINSRLKFFRHIWNAFACRMSIIWGYSSFTCCHSSPYYFRNAMPGWVLQAQVALCQQCLMMLCTVRREERKKCHSKVCDFFSWTTLANERHIVRKLLSSVELIVKKACYRHQNFSPFSWIKRFE